MAATKPAPAATPAPVPTAAPVAPVTAPTDTAEKPKRVYTPREAPTILGISNDVPMPARSTARGSKSAYDFDALTAVGMSIAVADKTAAQLASVVANANKKAAKNPAQAKNADGTPAFKMVEMKDQGGNVIGMVPAAPAEPIYAAPAHYFAADCDPATDPLKATARIFRNA